MIFFVVTFSSIATDAEEQDPWRAFGPLTKNGRGGETEFLKVHIIFSQNISRITGVSLTSKFLPSPKNQYANPPECSFQS